MGGCQNPALTHSHMTQLSQPEKRPGWQATSCPRPAFLHTPQPRLGNVSRGGPASADPPPTGAWPPPLLSGPGFSPPKHRRDSGLEAVPPERAWLMPRGLTLAIFPLGALVSASFKQDIEIFSPCLLGAIALHLMGYHV